MGSDLDVHIGKRIRRRRKLLELTQEQLGEKVGVRFQQIQKYEKGECQVTSNRLFLLARALHVEVGYFYEGFTSFETPTAANDHSADPIPEEFLESDDVRELLRTFGKLSPQSRRRLLDLARSLRDDAKPVAS